MRIANATIWFAILAGFTSAGLGATQPGDDVIWLTVCGQPDMSIALPLRGERDAPDRQDCLDACHAALCRKALGAEAVRGAQGAHV